MSRPLNEQVVVITGASSGIGRETALLFAERGAKVVLAARDEQALNDVKSDIERLGGQAHVVVTDVAEWTQVERLAQQAADHFGRIDTWVNNASTSLYGTVEQTPVDEIQRAIQVILMGQVHGMKAAIPHLKRNGQGTLINVGSVLSMRAVPLQAAYVAAKHAVRGFTESLRMELKHEGSNVRVTLVMPSSINTPLFEHARSHLGVLPQPIPPFYAPRNVAEAIVHAARHPMRDIVVGGSGKALLLTQRLSPGLLDRFMLLGGSAFRLQQTSRPDDGRNNLHAPMPGTDRPTGDFDEKTRRVSVYTHALELHPARKKLLVAAAALGALAFVRRAGRR